VQSSQHNPVTGNVITVCNVVIVSVSASMSTFDDTDDDDLADSFAAFLSMKKASVARTPDSNINDDTPAKLSNPERQRLGIQRSPSAREKLMQIKDQTDKPKNYQRGGYTIVEYISKLMISKKDRKSSFANIETKDDKMAALQQKLAEQVAKTEEELKRKNMRIAELERSVKELEAELDSRVMNSDFQGVGQSRDNFGTGVISVFRGGGNDSISTSVDTRLVEIEKGVTNMDTNLRRTIKVIENYAANLGRNEEYLLHVKELHEENKKLRILLVQQQQKKK